MKKQVESAIHMLAFNILRSITAAIRNSAIGQPRTVPNYLGTFFTGEKSCAVLRYSEATMRCRTIF